MKRSLIFLHGPKAYHRTLQLRTRSDRTINLGDFAMIQAKGIAGYHFVMDMGQL